MKTKQVTAQLYPVARPLTVQPGQYVMVVADMVIGVYTGNDIIPVNAVPREPALREEPARAQVATPVKTKVKKHKKSGTHRTKAGSQPITTVAPIITTIAEALHRIDTIHATDLEGTTGVEPNTAGYWRVRDALAWLSANGWMTTIGHGRHRIYTKGPNLPPSTAISNSLSRGIAA